MDNILSFKKPDPAGEILAKLVHHDHRVQDYWRELAAPIARAVVRTTPSAARFTFAMPEGVSDSDAEEFRASAGQQFEGYRRKCDAQRFAVAEEAFRVLRAVAERHAHD